MKKTLAFLLSLGLTVSMLAGCGSKTNETSCGSFRERTGSSMKDSYTDDCGCDKIQIDCKAHNCTYNDNCKCTASSIQVDGSNAHASSDTRCDTFQCHCGA